MVGMKVYMFEYNFQELNVLTSGTIAVQVICHKRELNEQACGFEQKWF